jgi:hypothetical protein
MKENRKRMTEQRKMEKKAMKENSKMRNRDR